MTVEEKRPFNDRPWTFTSAMERFKEAVAEIVSDPVIASYLQEAAELSDTADAFKQVAVPWICTLESVVSSEEDAEDLASALFSLRNAPVEPPVIEMETPMIMAALIQDGVEDPFDQDRLAVARLQLHEVGTVPELADNVESKRYVRLLKKEEAAIEKVRQDRLESNDRENAQFRHGMGFRRPEVRQLRHLRLDPINVHIGPLTLIENASLTIAPGNRYGLVGRNGLGKTTLMKFINSSLVQGVTDDMLIIHVEQEAPVSERCVLDAVLDTDIERIELLEELARLEEVDDAGVPERMVAINDRLEQIGAKEAVARASMILLALGFSHEQLEQPLSLMSGGFRMRVSLAQALYIRPDVLLLDEPTGHLDAPSVCWLEEFLSKSCTDQVLVVISHDRVFLDNVCTHIIHLKDKHLEVYKMDYSHFVAEFERRCSLAESQAEAQQRDIDHKLDFVRRLGVKAASASMAQSRLKAVAKIELIKPIVRDPPVKFDFSMTSLSAEKELVQLDDVSFAYVPGKMIFEHLTFQLKRKTRAVIIGANGAGKSTFLNILLGRLEPLSGYYRMIANLRIATFSQHHVDQLDYRSTPLQYMLNLFRADYPIAQIRAQLGKFGISGEQSLQPIQSLSGGQKTRVVLAQCALTKPHVLMLDEVTNNLDMDSIQALGVALRNYQGAILAVTHDQHFATLIANEIYVCKDKNIEQFHGTFQEYREKVKAEIRERFFRTVAGKGIV
jgi:ATP-binding cassette subfamily F protein 3